MVSLPGILCPKSKKRVNVACIDPTVGMMHRGGTSTSMNAFRNLLPASFNLGIPEILGYWLAMPLRKAAHSASIPVSEAGSPGLPISRCTNLSPRCRSSLTARAKICLMVAEAMFGIFIARISLSSC